RMYPETDVPPIEIENRRLSAIRKNLPEMLEDKVSRFKKELGLNAEIAGQMVSSHYLLLFEKLLLFKISPKDLANIFVNVVPDLKKRDNVKVSKITDSQFEEVVSLLSSGKIIKDAVPLVLKDAALGADIGKIITENNLTAVSEKEAGKIINEIISKEKTPHLKSVVGKAMGALRGRIENKKIFEIVNKEIKG
ncbi:MAG: hypothetical protein KAI53_02545, partial [Candidatus Aenigmarchaeota archaeon]|nr:hypothetical protein [Candidatus Aenigmarchaeota archaeon]